MRRAGDGFESEREREKRRLIIEEVALHMLRMHSSMFIDCKFLPTCDTTAT